MKERQIQKEPLPRMDESPRSSDGLMQLLKEWRKTFGYYSIFAAVPALLAGAAHELRAEGVLINSQTVPLQSDAFRQWRKNRTGLLGTQDFNRRASSNPLLPPPSSISSDDCPGTPIPAGSYTAASPYVDNGDTTGANDTVTSLYYYRCPYYCYLYQADSHGPDRIYSFVMTNAGPNPSITVTTNSPNYRPLIYLTSGCPAGQRNTFYYDIWAIDDSRSGSGNTASIDGSYLSIGRRYYLFVDSQLAGDSGAYTLTLKDIQISSAPPVRTNRPDFDGDGRTDLSVFRPSDATWYTNRSSQGFTATQFGLSTDKPIPEDYDGDGKTDIAVFRDGDWWILKSSDSTPEVIHFGQAGDIPVPSDYSGDGRSEIAVFRNGEWWIYNLANGQPSLINFGQAGDQPIPADYTGDGRSEIAVFRAGQWWICDLATGQYKVINFGQAGDIPVPGDYGVSGSLNLAVYRNGSWYVNFGGGNVSVFPWGLPSDIPTPGDYDGDGRNDLAVYRDGTWWIYQSSSGNISATNFGLPGDQPVPSAFLR